MIFARAGWINGMPEVMDFQAVPMTLGWLGMHVELVEAAQQCMVCLSMVMLEMTKLLMLIQTMAGQ